ncbi:hypothetical protein RhiirA4_446966 [Rhizophagus irregularis]|uniref:Uncharacterized protein n=1 Tax=Rhizophagus irregularis TaxID=588596 RepID=A0A2I1GYS1_9GLOM|nr:hypothetical protein RhiirA4_446966 [Rhizophagus irregularis]
MDLRRIKYEKQRGYLLVWDVMFHVRYWNKSLYFVSNLNKYSKRQTSDHDFYERAYKIKNLLKALPTYANMIDNDICIRCEKEVEDWDHIWICEAIEFRERELLRGVYNNRFNKITNDKDERKMIFSLWVYCYEELKNKFGKKGARRSIGRLGTGL